MKKILIISSNRLGDSILTSGLINYYRSKYKNTKITFACGELPSLLFKYCNKIEKGIVVKKGKDISLIAVGYVISESIEAANILQKEGIDVEIIDPRTISPLDIKLFVKSVNMKYNIKIKNK